MQRHFSHWLIAALLLCFSVQLGHASPIKSLAKRLSSGKSIKVRISAALSLAKSKNKRAVVALSNSLLRDRSAVVRRVVASSMGKQLRLLTKADVRSKAKQSLLKALRNDKSSKVRNEIKLALRNDVPMVVPQNQSKARRILVSVEKPTRQDGSLSPRTAQLIQTTVRNIIRTKSPSSISTAPGTGMPASATLRKKQLTGFSIFPTIGKLSLTRQGSRATVECALKLKVSPWGQRPNTLALQRSATASGSASVTSGSSKQAIRHSTEVCLNSVLEQITAEKILPYLATKLH